MLLVVHKHIRTLIQMGLLSFYFFGGCASTQSRIQPKINPSAKYRPSLLSESTHEPMESSGSFHDPDEILQRIADQSVALCSQLRRKFSDQYGGRLVDQEDLMSSSYLQTCGAIYQTETLKCVEGSVKIPSYLADSERAKADKTLGKRKKSCVQNVSLRTASQLVFQIEYSIHLRKNLSETAREIVEDPERYNSFLQTQFKTGFRTPVSI